MALWLAAFILALPILWVHVSIVICRINVGTEVRTTSGIPPIISVIPVIPEIPAIPKIPAFPEIPVILETQSEVS